MRRPEEQVGPEYRPITSEYLDYDEVMEKYDEMMDMARTDLCRDIEHDPLYA